MPTLIGDGGHARDIWATLPQNVGWRQVAHHDNYFTIDRNANPVIIGINDPMLRLEVAAMINQDCIGWVHPNAFVGPDCTFGVGTHVNYSVGVTRTTIGEYCTIAPGVTICGDVVIGNRVFVGAGAIIVNLTTVPDDTFIKAGTVWTQR